MNRTSTIVAEPQAKYQVYDSIFLDCFSDKDNLLALYKILLGEEADNTVKSEDIEPLNAEKIIINDLYNDLSFVVDQQLIILVEAQSTYSKNIATRLLFYVANALEHYLRLKTENDKLPNLYGSKIVEIPRIKLYTVYTGEQVIREEYIRLSDVVKAGDGDIDIDLKVKVLSIADKSNILGQYISFCHIFREQKRLYEDKEEAINKTIEICLNEQILKDYLNKRKYEVRDMMAHLITREDWEEYVREEAMEQGLELGREQGMEIGVEEEKNKIALNMLSKDMNVDAISELTELSVEEVLALKQKL